MAVGIHISLKTENTKRTRSDAAGGASHIRALGVGRMVGRGFSMLLVTTQ